MIGRLSAAALAKAKVTGLVAVSLTAGSVGGAVALSHVAPLTQMVRDTAVTASPSPGDDGDETAATEDPAQDPTPAPENVSADDGDATAGSGPAEDLDADGSDGYALPECTDDISTHGDYASSVARTAPTVQVGGHGDVTRLAAQSDCGKPDGSGGDGAGGTTDSEPVHGKPHDGAQPGAAGRADGHRHHTSTADDADASDTDDDGTDEATTAGSSARARAREHRRVSADGAGGDDHTGSHGRGSGSGSGHGSH